MPAAASPESASTGERTAAARLAERAGGEVLLIVNPRSGRGRAARIGTQLAATLTAAGFHVRRIDLGAPDAAHLVSAHADAADAAHPSAAPRGDIAAIVVGGDGTVHSCAGMLARAAIPLYHVPTGTENLFARQFNMKPAPARIVEALRRGRTITVDVGECRAAEPPSTAPGLASPRAFLVMGSVGFDAGVIHRLAAARRGAISHWSYVGPIAREFLQHRAPLFSVDVDGRRIVDNVRGVAIVANSRQYAMRIDPAHRAEMNDGLLDLVFFPARRLTDVSAWALLARLRLHHRRRTLTTARGRDMRLHARDGRAVLQLDGEAVGPPDATEGAWTFSLRPNALHVLT